ncbi:Retrovirus-related Pol polyprotein from transposon TNT 1-94 [Dendrobium catenatum]|uniref:Retrovirus-related Pol polyprotein from transposon TNT 1-94 n=1 Tax=Dendrobium catenatum TaxID=906689 RepID=A0A2I0X4X7_9ASPA|nr:Retrovirus-related Pol polyprotein from transposon TNT 1-94 [Dendrobium catenatum]
MQAPSEMSFQMIKRVLCYLKGTSNLDITIHRSNLNLTAFTDVDWGSNHTHRRSISVYCFFLDTSRIPWKVQKQKTMAWSSTEVEYCTLVAASSKLIWLHWLLQDLSIPIKSPTLLFFDNTSTISIANNPILRASNKHIEIDLHFIRDHIASKTFTIYHISTTDQLADILTKSLPKSPFHHLRDKLQHQPIESTV